MEIIKVLKDVIAFAQKSNDIDMVQKIITAQEAVLDLQNQLYELRVENSELKNKLKRDYNIVRYRGIPILSIKDDEKKILYCANCYGKENKLIPVHVVDHTHTICRMCGDQCELKYSPDFKLIEEFLD